jgi:hypothetical protein
MNMCILDFRDSTEEPKKDKIKMTIESLRNDQQDPGRVIRAFKLPGQAASRVEIIENVASDTEPGTDEFVVSRDGRAEIIMGLRPTTSFGTYLGIASIEPDKEVAPDLLQVSAETLLDAKGIDEALVPLEARSVRSEEMSSLFGSHYARFGMYAVHAAPHADLELELAA